MFHVVNATAVRLTWSGSVHLSTCIQYTIICSDTGVIIGQYERVLPPVVTSTVWVLDDNVILTDVYMHQFTLYYIIPNVVFPLSTTVTTFNFGKILPNIFSKCKNARFLDKKDFQIQFGPLHYCLDWGVSHSIAIISLLCECSCLPQLQKTDRIEKQLQKYVIHVVRKNCAECYDLTPSFLQTGVFLCHEKPTNTTYRSTIVNPFPTTKNVTQLVGIIQSWVSSGPSLILDGLLVRVSADCPTAISSLDEGECESESRSRPDQGLAEMVTQTLNVCALRDLGSELICDL